MLNDIKCEQRHLCSALFCKQTNLESFKTASARRVGVQKNKTQTNKKGVSKLVFSEVLSMKFFLHPGVLD